MTFNGHKHSEFVPQKTAAYVGQNDLHVGQLTVRETLDFSANVQGVGPLYGTTLFLHARFFFFLSEVDVQI